MRSETKRERDRQAARASYWSDPVASRIKRRAISAAQRAKRIAWINQYKVERGCVDCGYNAHPGALQFDHIDPATKRFGIAKGLTYSTAVIKAEIAKCEIRCANCHAIRSIAEGHLGRPRVDGIPRRPRRTPPASLFDI